MIRVVVNLYWRHGVSTVLVNGEDDWSGAQGFMVETDAAYSPDVADDLATRARRLAIEYEREKALLDKDMEGEGD